MNYQVILETCLSTGQWLYMGEWLCYNIADAQDIVTKYAGEYLDSGNQIKSDSRVTVVYDASGEPLVKFSIKEFPA